MSTGQGVETLVTVRKSSIQDYVHLNDQAQPTYEMHQGSRVARLKIKLSRRKKNNSVLTCSEDFNHVPW